MKREYRIMVCVTLQNTCKRLIDAGAKIARMTNGKVFVVHVAGPKSDFLGNTGYGEALECLFEASKKADAEMTVLESEDCLNEIINFTNVNKINQIVIGKSNDTVQDESTYQYLRNCLGDIEIIVVPP